MSVVEAPRRCQFESSTREQACGNYGKQCVKLLNDTGSSKPTWHGSRPGTVGLRAVRKGAADEHPYRLHGRRCHDGCGGPVDCRRPGGQVDTTSGGGGGGGVVRPDHDHDHRSGNDGGFEHHHSPNNNGTHDYNNRSDDDCLGGTAVNQIPGTRERTGVGCNRHRPMRHPSPDGSKSNTTSTVGCLP